MTVPAIRALQICNGLGAGNIGDEFMARGFWASLPRGVSLGVEIFPNYATQRAPYPEAHRLLPLDWQGAGPLPEEPLPGLVVGDTPVTETLGLGWPLQFLAPRLERFHQRKLPVDAVGVGIEPLRSAEARAIFDRAFSPVRSWTVRSPRCRQRLLELGVPDDCIAVGADCAWAYRPQTDLRPWGAGVWRELGVDPARPLLVANVVNEIWRSRSRAKEPLAAALDVLAREAGLQVAFFCNEIREGEFFDQEAASEVRSLMEEPAVMVPPEHYAPDEVLGLLSHATVTLSQRYHFTVESILADTPPVSIARSEKVNDLLEDLELCSPTDASDVSAEAIVTDVLAAIESRDRIRHALREAHRRLAARAERNLSFLGWLLG